MRQILLYFWQLPQNLAGVLLLFLFGGRRHEDYGVVWYYTPRIKGGISLGDYIFISNGRRDAILHEGGHRLQSLMLGWLYLPVVGIPSLLWATIYGLFIDPNKVSYYSFYTERWADKLAGIDRK